jgi:glucokinase
MSEGGAAAGSVPADGRRAGAVAAVDLGGTAMKGAVSRAPGELGPVESRPTGREAGPEAVLGRLEDFLAELIGEAVEAVGVAVPGLVDDAAGVARNAVNLGWHDVPLRDRLAARLGLPVAVGHDVRAAALAEGELGAARGCRDWLLVTLGTGVGAAVMLGGRPYAGAHGNGGELGHMVVDPDGPPCNCGNRGCVESFASAAAIERRYGGGATAKEIAAGGDEKARRVWAEAVEALAAGLAAFVVTMDPERIVIGGGLASAGEALFAPLTDALGERVVLGEAPPVVPAALGSDAGCHGAALLAREATAAPREAA